MPSFELPDIWKLDSGLRDAATVTVVNPYFGYTANYQDGKVLRFNLGCIDEETEPLTIKMSVGSDWSSPDGGKTITHPTKSRINNSSIYGRFIQYAIEIDDLAHYLVDRGLQGPLSAEIWLNVKMRLESKEFQFGKPGPDNPPRSYLMPVEFLGIDTGSGQTVPASGSMGGGGVATSTAPATTTPATQAPPAQPAQAASVADRVAAARAAKSSPQDSPLVSRLKEIAKSSSSHEDFVNKAFEIDEVLADDELAQQVATPSGIYSQSN